jgi:hypothetical protein
MILDNCLDFDQKVYISMIAGAIWIYFRTLDCYNLIPRRQTFSILFVVPWIYINYYEPLALPIGLLILYLYSCK